MSGNTWPEQDAVDAWFEKHLTRAAIMELKSAVTKYRIEVQTERDRLRSIAKVDIAHSLYADDYVRSLVTERDNLRLLATRWPLPDGTYETLPEEEVERKKRAAAKVLARAEDVEGIAKVLANTHSDNWALGEAERSYWREKASAVVRYLTGKE